MTYTKPNMFELGSAQALVLGEEFQRYLESDGQTVNSPEIVCPTDPNEFILADGSCGL